ncbi:MAG: NCS1 family nucleobase:cation symporter-1 [Deltaproteobacteria bacterium]|nr:NCS1 family nucleobase:cation symporter-1 [Deltaproteobacteria bacterium]
MTPNALSNPDLAPVPAERRTWTATHFFSLWVGMAVCIPTYMIAASLIQGGMDWRSALLTVLLGNCIVLIPMLLNGHAGTKYGIPFPILARAGFGIRGSNLPALLRAIVACGWFGIQCWIGGAALYTLLLALWPAAADVALQMPAFIGVGVIPFACFLVFWAIHLYLIWSGIESIKYLETICAPFLLLCGIALLGWAYRAADGFGPMLAAPARFTSRNEFWQFFFPALTGMVGFWATLSLNISDFSRYGKTQRAQVLGQTLGLPTTMTMFAFIGIAVTSATIVLFGEPIWDPVALVRKFDSPILVAVSMFAVLIATLSTNVAANIVGPANDFSNLAPAKINFKRGGYITGVIGIVMMPWKLVADPTGYIFTWLIGYSALLGPVAAILLVDYFVIRRCRLVVDDLYRDNGVYQYTNGWNLRALAALLVGVLPNVPGFLAQIGLVEATRFPTLNALYHYAWFIGFAGAGASYYTLMLRTNAARTTAAAQSEVA